MTKKQIVLTVTIIALLAIGVFALEKTGVTHFWHKDTVATGNGPTKEQKAAEDKFNSDAKKEFIEGSGSSQTTTTPNPTDSSAITLSAQKENNGTVTIFSKLTSVSSGKCQLTVVNGSKQNTQSADVIYQPEFSTCAGFSVPISQLGNGTWQIKLGVNSNGQNIEKNITFEVK